MAGSTKSKNLHIQSIGRAFRSETPLIIDLVDSNYVSKRHWRERKKNYEAMNCEIKEFFIEDKDKPIDIEELHNDRLKAFLEKTKA